MSGVLLDALIQAIGPIAQKLGVKKVYVEDLRETFVKDYVFPMLRGNAMYEGCYLLGTSIARPLIARRQAEIALKEGARVEHVKAKGYGNALRGGFAAARARQNPVYASRRMYEPPPTRRYDPPVDPSSDPFAWRGDRRDDAQIEADSPDEVEIQHRRRRRRSGHDCRAHRDSKNM